MDVMVSQKIFRCLLMAIYLKFLGNVKTSMFLTMEAGIWAD